MYSPKKEFFAPRIFGGRDMKRAILLVALTFAAQAQASPWKDFQLKLKNFDTVVAGEVYRSAQLDRGDLDYAIAKYGIKTIINLRGAADGKDWYDDELRAAAAGGATVHSIGMSATRLDHAAD